jgi:hypothetical protein
VHVSKIRPTLPLQTNSLKNVPVKPIHTPVRLSFEYIQAGKNFCLSNSEKSEVKDVMDCLRQLTSLSWYNVLNTGGKHGNKDGLGHTPYKDHELRCTKRPAALSPDIQISAVRASKKYRVFGCYFEHVYYLLWFDRNHEIVPSG